MFSIEKNGTPTYQQEVINNKKRHSGTQSVTLHAHAHFDSCTFYVQPLHSHLLFSERYAILFFPTLKKRSLKNIFSNYTCACACFILLVFNFFEFNIQMVYRAIESVEKKAVLGLYIGNLVKSLRNYILSGRTQRLVLSLLERGN